MDIIGNRSYSGNTLFNLSIDDYYLAAQAVGFRTRRGSIRLNILSGVCHNGGDNPNGVWVTEHNGHARAFCHKCPSSESDRNVRRNLGLPEWRPPPSPASRNDVIASNVERYQYHNPDTGETATQVVERYSMVCWRNRRDSTHNGYCGEQYPHKHPWMERDEQFKGTPTDGFLIKLHDTSDADGGLSGKLVIAEGQKTSNAIVAAGWQAASYPQGSGYAPRANYTPVIGRNVMIAPDNDFTGRIAAYETAIACLQHGANTVEILTAVGKSGTGDDLADVPLLERQIILQGGGISISSIFGLQCAIEMLQLNRRCSLHPRHRLPLLDASDQHAFALHLRDAWDAVFDFHIPPRGTGDPSLYEYTGAVGFIESGSSGLTARAHNRATGKKMTSNAIEWYRGWGDHVLARGASNGTFLSQDEQNTIISALKDCESYSHGFVIYNESYTDAKNNHIAEQWVLKRPHLIFPNVSIIDGIVEERIHGLPILTSIRKYPTISADGQRILDQSGYQWEEKFFLNIDFVLIPMTLQDAIDEIEKLFGEFPFETSIDKANFYALLISPIISPSVGIKPIFYINKATPRTGATKIAKLLSLIIAAEEPSETGPLGRDSEEIKKSIGAAASNSTGIVLFDNMEGNVKSGEFARYVTSMVYNQRLLGRNDRSLSIYKDTITDVMTGNNVTFSDEMAHRILDIRLNARVPDPQNRTFSIKNPEQYAKTNRVRLLSAIITLVINWQKLQCPYTATIPLRLGGFEAWRDMVGNILESAGVYGFLQHGTERAAGVIDDGGERAFIDWWWEKHGSAKVTVAEIGITDVVGSADDAGIVTDLRGANLGDRRKSLGKALSRWAGKIYETEAGQVELVRESNGKKAVMYRLVPHVASGLPENDPNAVECSECGFRFTDDGNTRCEECR